MTPRALLSWAGIFSMVMAVNGGCDRREETPAQRAPRVVGSSAELFALDDAGTAKDEHVVRELVGDWTPPAAIETGRPPPPARKAKRVDAVPKPKEEVVTPEEPMAQPQAQEPTREPEAAPLPPPQEAKHEAPSKTEAIWQTVPEPRNSRADAINVSLAIGTVAVGVGSAAVSGDNTSTGARAFAIGSLGVGVASLSTALILYLTEPDGKSAATSKRVTVTPLGVRGTF